ncbi:uncharacterized protein LOC134262089 isoform X4 [Saccostrea cucullata]|uniref:uncharacterized protein LOC134262089 isoform X4 n=1 Tax=Saccostrea cuccullata TaxID=36930 RepID=UPI002ED1ED40
MELCYRIEVCLETPFHFVFRGRPCWFTLAEAKLWFEAETGDCPKKCQVKISNIENEAWSHYHQSYYTLHYQLNSFTLRFNGLSENLTIINTSCTSSYTTRRNLKIICRSDFDKAVDDSNDLCTSIKKCEDETKTCSLKGQIGVCVCNPGYIGLGNECLQGNLTLNRTCKLNEQCPMVFGSICQKNTCVCGPGYKPYNDSECLLHSENGEFEGRAMGLKEYRVVGLMVGAVIGGLMLGIVLSVLGIIIYNIRNEKHKTGKKQYPKAAVFKNTTYEAERDADQNISTVQCERKFENMPKCANSNDFSVTQNTRTFHGNKSSMMKSYDVNDDVYNHLHDKEEDSDIDETYDHTHGNISSAMEETDYSNLNTGIRYKEPDVSAAEDIDYDDRETPADYCSLKKK